MKAPNVTAGDWTTGEFDSHLGYDCMTGGIRAAKAYLDGAQYGQRRCADITPEAKALMESDAKMLAASKKLAEALNTAYCVQINKSPEHRMHPATLDEMRAALLSAGYTEGE